MAFCAVLKRIASIMGGGNQTLAVDAHDQPQVTGTTAIRVPLGATNELI